MLSHAIQAMIDRCKRDTGLRPPADPVLLPAAVSNQMLVGLGITPGTVIMRLRGHKGWDVEVLQLSGGPPFSVTTWDDWERARDAGWGWG